MRLYRMAIPALAVPAMLAAQPWTPVHTLPGDIVIELDEASVTEALDGERQVLQATFRRQMPNGLMQTDVAVDCNREAAKIRAVRLLDGNRILNQNVALSQDYSPIHDGSSEAIYFEALCGQEVTAHAPSPQADEAE